MVQPLIVVVILNTNRCADTLECLASLRQSSYPNVRTIVLDNHSTDGSVEAIQSAYPTVQIIRLTENQGYAGNNNVGIAAAIDQGAEWVFVLNEDTILHRDCLTFLTNVGEGSERIGIVGPMVYHHDEPQVIQSAGGQLNRYWNGSHYGQNEPDQGQFAYPRQVQWISGCGILVHRAVVEQVGMLDPRFFYYWEETEWCVRASKAGWQIVHVPQAKLWHKGVQVNYRPKPSVTYYATRNRLLMMAKHHAPTIAWVQAWTQLLRTLTSWSIKPKWRAMHEHRNAMWRGLVDFLYGRWGQMPS